MRVEVRETNVQQIKAGLGEGLIPVHQKMLDFCLLKSEMLYYGLVDEKVACAWGLVPPTIISDNAYIWLHHTDLVEKHKFLFIRYSQRAVGEMLDRYSEINGHAHGQNERGIRWLKWLGAKMIAPEGDLIPFQIRRKDG